MPTDAQLSLKTRKILFASLLALICIVLVYAAFQRDRPWVVPEEVKKLKNPVVPTESTLKAASGIYMDECAQCHGERDRKSTRLNSSHTVISYAVFCLKKKKKK